MKKLPSLHSVLSWTKKDMLDKYRKYGILSEKKMAGRTVGGGGGGRMMWGGRWGGGVAGGPQELSDDGHGSGSFSSLGFLSSLKTLFCRNKKKCFLIQLVFKRKGT